MEYKQPISCSRCKIGWSSTILFYYLLSTGSTAFSTPPAQITSIFGNGPQQASVQEEPAIIYKYDVGSKLVEKADHFYFKENKNRQAFLLYEEAASLGNMSALASLAKLWASGRGTGVGKDLSIANAYADISFASIKRLAEKNNRFAQYQLGTLYGVRNDPGTAVVWYKKSAEQGEANAQASLGISYRNGIGIEQSYAEAIYWLRKAVKQGQAYGQNGLGVMYEKGEATPQNDTKAVKWYLIAAKRGVAEAQYNIGRMYEYGNGVAQDYQKAAYWFRKASEKGISIAKKDLITLCLKITSPFCP